MADRGYLRCLSFAGSDPTAGAGLQADLKTFQSVGVLGATVVTAITAQNSAGVQGVWCLPLSQVKAQYESVLAEHSLRCFKIGMIGNDAIVSYLAQVLPLENVPIILDPVAFASVGSKLYEDNAYLKTLKQLLIPRCTLITPNVREAALLCEWKEEEILKDPKGAARSLLGLGCRAVLLKGGHLSGEQAVDYYATSEDVMEFVSPRIVTAHTHGSGCTLATAICAYLVQYAQSRPDRELDSVLRESIQSAKKLVTASLARAASFAGYVGVDSAATTPYGAVLQSAYENIYRV